LREKGITNVLNVTKRGQVKSHFEEMGEFNYKRLAIEDVLDAKIEECWDEAFQFLDAVADGGGNVLVHCRAGRSRSVSIVVGWAMKRLGWTLKHAWEAVSEARTNARPNMGFQMKLMHLECELRQCDINSIDFFDKSKRSKKPEYFRDLDFSKASNK